MKKIVLLFVALSLVAGTVVEIATAQSAPAKKADAKPPKLRKSAPLTEREMNMAKIAWKYFENNYQPETGFVNSVDGYPSVTMWDMASYLSALAAAYELEVIPKNVFDTRMANLLQTLSRLSLYRGETPNKAYHTKTAEKVDYGNKPAEIGFSALDLGRALIWFKIIKERYPEHSNGIDNALMRWKFCNLISETGDMNGAYVDKDGKTKYVQEGRLGYEEYAAKGFQMWGFNTRRASLHEPYTFLPIYGVEVPYDNRDPRILHAHTYVVTESYVLDGIEFNWDLADDYTSPDSVHTDSLAAVFAQRIYEVQARRYEETGIITARTEHQLDGPPYFVYDTIYSDGFPWNTITDDGKFVPEFAAISLKGALGLWVLWDTEYTQLLFDTIADLYDPEKGYYEGRYEKSGGLVKAFTANNNGIMLSSLLYKAKGKIYRKSNQESVWDKALKDEFTGKDKCLPHHR